jgi:hypothetical protein
VEHGGGIVVGDRGHQLVVPAVNAPDALQRQARLAPAAMRAQLGVVVEFDQLGVGLIFFCLGALDLGRQRRAAARDGLAGVVREFAVRVTAEREPSDLACSLVAVGEGERLDPLRRRGRDRRRRRWRTGRRGAGKTGCRCR